MQFYKLELVNREQNYNKANLIAARLGMVSLAKQCSYIMASQGSGAAP